ncbi:MAG: hypothetical protein V1492_02660 [Candidatus Micrarchaeota archaeon]
MRTKQVHKNEVGKKSAMKHPFHLMWYPEPMDFKTGEPIKEKPGQIGSIRYEPFLGMRRKTLLG